MARVIAGMGTSHVPGVGAAMDNGKTHEDYWQKLFAGFGPLRAWHREQRATGSPLHHDEYMSWRLTDLAKPHNMRVNQFSKHAALVPQTSVHVPHVHELAQRHLVQHFDSERKC